MCSQIAAAAEAQEDLFMTEMISAPLLATLLMKASSRKALSTDSVSLKEAPFTWAK